MMDEEDDTRDGTPIPTGGLPRETVPPPQLEERVVAALAVRGLLKPSPRRPASRAATVALVAAALLMGIGIGALLARPEARADRFVFFLHATPAAGEAAAGDEAGRVREYAEWARELRRRGVPIRGEKLADEVHTLGGPPGPGAGEVAGYFVLGVTDPREAMAVAESCPHLRHGGRIEVRRIESR